MKNKDYGKNCFDCGEFVGVETESNLCPECRLPHAQRAFTEGVGDFEYAALKEINSILGEPMLSTLGEYRRAKYYPS